MRSRPRIKVLLSPAAITPGARVEAECIFTSKGETPVDWITMRLQGRMMAALTQSIAHASSFYDREARIEALTLTPGEHRRRAVFDLPHDVPCSYRSYGAAIEYRLHVHVSIPWWPDRVQEFIVPVMFGVVPPPEPEPRTYASASAPTGDRPFLEAALDSVIVAQRDVITGSIAVSNLRGARLRGIDVALCEMEHVHLPQVYSRVVQRFGMRVHAGTPVEGETIRFKIRLPLAASASFNSRAFDVRTLLEVRAVVAYGDDVVLRIPLTVTPLASGERARGWVAPVGRQRSGAIWREVAQRAGLGLAPDGERMVARRGAVSVAIDTENRGGVPWLVGALSYPTLGLDLDVGERRWTDALAMDVVPTGDVVLDDRFAVHAREPAQAARVVTRELLATLAPFSEVDAGDEGARLATQGPASPAAPLERFVSRVLAAADALDAASRRVPSPAAFERDVPAWAALAEQLRGRLELGHMVIRDGSIGVDRVDVGSVWSRAGLLIGSLVRVRVDPPLASAPSLDSPELSAAARDLWRELAGKVRSLAITHAEITLEIEGKLADPAAALPLVELAVRLRRALAGHGAAGPFR